MKIRIEVNEIELTGELKKTSLAEKITEILPIISKGRTWGEEIYFPVSLKEKLQYPTEVVEIGDLAYWEEGNCLCLFYGKTPISTEDEIRPASPVEVVGQFTGNMEELKKISSECSVRVKKL